MGFSSRHGSRFFHCRHTQTGSVDHPASYPKDTRTYIPRVKEPHHKTEHSHSPRSEVKQCTDIDSPVAWHLNLLRTFWYQNWVLALWIPRNKKIHVRDCHFPCTVFPEKVGLTVHTLILRLFKHSVTSAGIIQCWVRRENNREQWVSKDWWSWLI
jgi:hypothetical protein